MIISYKLQPLDFSDDINNLLCQIDTKLSNIAENRFISSRFGAKVCINYEDYKLLAKYRKILSNKANNHCCLKDYLIDDIISRIKQLLNRN